MAKALLTLILTMEIIVTAVISAAVGGKVQEQGGCSCGVFPENSETPIIVQSLQYNVSCDEEGAGICRNLCIALAQGAKDQAPALICEKINKHIENLKVAVFTKTSCNVKTEWIFTGLKTPDPICCDGGKETVCKLETDS